MRLLPGSQQGHERSGGIRVQPAFTRGQELPLTPAVCHKGPEPGRGHGQPPSFPPSLSWGKGNKSGDFVSPLLNTNVRAEEEAVSSPLSPLSHSGPSQPCCVGSPSIWQGSFAPGLQINSPTAKMHGCSPLAFYIFGSLYSELLRYFSI